MKSTSIFFLLKRHFALLILFLSIPLLGYAQINIMGTVSDDIGEVLPGVNIMVKGSQKGVITDLNGKFSISVASGSTLVFSYMGYESQEVKIGNNRNLNIVLKSSSATLDEVVVTGYGGEVRRRDLTGSIAKANMDDINKAPVSSFDQALAGRVAGVVVSSNEGMPGGEMNIVIRGNNSLTQDNSPLYVVDGFPFENFNAGSLNTADIESIDILKDASATAIYGARGANGVIIITTKKGQVGAPRVTYDGYGGFQEITKMMDVLSPYDFVKYQAEIRPGDRSWEIGGTYFSPIKDEDGNIIQERDAEYYRNPPRTYDWQDYAYRMAFLTSHSLNISGGSAQTRYNATISYYNQDGVLINSNYERYQGKFSLDNRILKDKVRVIMSANYSDNTYTGTSPSNPNDTWAASNSLLYNIWTYRPVTYTENQDLLQTSFDPVITSPTDYRFNPVQSLENEYRMRNDRMLYANGSAEWEIIKNLKLKAAVGYNKRSVTNEAFNNSLTRSGNPTRPEGVNGSYSISESSGWSNDNTLSYTSYFKKKHSLTALVGISAQRQYSSYYSMSAKNLINESLGMSGLDEGNPDRLYSTKSSNSLFSYLGRLNYNYARKYYLTASFRADGSSKFARGNRWGYFPSGSLAWMLSEESFMKRIENILSSAKVRVSWGLTGNNRVGDFDYLAQLQSDIMSGYSFNNLDVTRGMVLSTIGNPELKWETTEQTNVGLDLAFWKSRINFTIDLYRKTTRDLLLNSDLPGSTGYSKAYKNIGKVRNQGVELTLGVDVIKTKKFTWNSSINFAMNQSKVLALADNQESMLTSVSFTGSYSSNPLYLSKLGMPMGMMVGYIYEGTYKYDDFDKIGSTYVLKRNIPSNGMARNVIQPGDEKYRDLNGDGIIDDNDRTVIGRGHPIHTGGWSNNFSYAGFDLNLFFQWSYGNDIYNANRLVMEGTRSYDTNQFATMLDRWTPENPTSNIPRAGANNPGKYSSRVVEDGSFIRLKTIQLGYNIPTELMKRFIIRNIRVYASAQNIFTLTNYSGGDPEVSVRHSAITPGFDYSAYPRAFTVNFGVNVNF